MTIFITYTLLLTIAVGAMMSLLDSIEAGLREHKRIRKELEE